MGESMQSNDDRERVQTETAGAAMLAYDMLRFELIRDKYERTAR